MNAERALHVTIQRTGSSSVSRWERVLCGLFGHAAIWADKPAFQRMARRVVANGGSLTVHCRCGDRITKIGAHA